MIHILMVEDDVELAEVLSQYLATFEIKVTHVDDPYLALSLVAIERFDLVILDLTLPGMDGLEVCEAMLKKHSVPIMISSARSDISDKVAALELGADDYLPKPYDPRELEVRIKTILRRYQNSVAATSAPEKAAIFVHDDAKKEIRKRGVPLRLTGAEYEVLALFIQKSGFVVSRETIVESCVHLRSDDEHSNSLSVIINRLRQKIEEDPKNPKYLETVRGMGYRFVA